MLELFHIFAITEKVFDDITFLRLPFTNYNNNRKWDKLEGLNNNPAKYNTYDN